MSFVIRTLVVVVVALFEAAGAQGQTAAGIDVGVAAGGNTNDVQLSYGAALELAGNDRFSGSVEVRYVRDFFEFEPDDPMTDALTYSGVTAVVATMRILSLSRPPERRGFVPYAIIGGGWLHAATADASANHAGYVAGAGLALFARPRTEVSFDAKRFATIGGSGEIPQTPFAFWTLGISTQFRWRP